MDYSINIQIFDNHTQSSTTSERKNYIKFVGILLDSNLSWKYYFDYATSKRSKKGQAANSHLHKLFDVLQKRALRLRLIYFSKTREHAVPLFISSNLLSLIMPYFETVSTLMYVISSTFPPSSICSFFTKTDEIHGYKTKSSNSGTLTYINISKMDQTFRFISVLKLIFNLNQISTYFVNKFLVIIHDFIFFSFLVSIS